MADAVAWEVIERAAAGDVAARRSLVEATVDNLWALALRLTRRRDEADDVVQETYTRVFAALSGLEPNGRFEGYLARIATNLVVERWRRHRPETPLTDGLLSPDAVEPWQTVADEEQEHRQLAAVWAAIQRLDPEPRAAVILFYAQGESCEGISRILDAPLGTVKTWLHRARNQVRQGAEVMLRSEPALDARAGSEDRP
jgi:RNA polymerase sigma-70 factor (ECF subfamily)